MTEGELEDERKTEDTEEDSVIMWGDNLTIVDLRKYHPEPEPEDYLQVDYIMWKLTYNKKLTDDNIKKAESNFVVDLKKLISTTATDPKMTSVRAHKGSEDTDTAPEG